MTHTIKVMYPPAETTQALFDPTLTARLDEFDLPDPRQRGDVETMIDYHEEPPPEPSRIVALLLERKELLVDWACKGSALAVGFLTVAALAAAALLLIVLAVKAL